ncbi:macro domain-containing protein [Actinoplanes flavus]|uniref:Bacterial transcriptional activator domain-containing protein n=1 Tax=Actinoplanes flavus TaxID=2820290 RepID=A0ABS3URJ3_9ACTN|nr:macro domain-containing protein [Actinoplanes flavus]MBO3741161.1 bacterial transcriptional activator domain-containing protein [Actinoplanes flavus]
MPWRLSPRSIAVLLRLAVDAGEFVPVDRIYRDVWRDARNRVDRHERTQVQKAVNEIRRAGANLVETYRLGRTASYRWGLAPDRIDFLRYRDLVGRARRSDAAMAVDLLREASALWRGGPLPEVSHLPFAKPVIDGLCDLRAAADRDLLQACVDIGRYEEALGLAERLVTEHPGDDGLSLVVADLRRRLRSGRRDLLRRTLHGAQPSTVSVVVGDLLAEDDAHLVIGFTDTFDTDARQDVVISGGSLQAEAARRFFGDDRGLLDRRLRNALAEVQPEGRETRAAKRRGKLIRYPVGTVAVLRAGGRLLFAVAYSRMGNDLVARSSEQDVAVSLERLWDAVYLHGQLRPVAVPLIGAGLSRISSATPDQLIMTLAGSFAVRNRAARISPELRIVLRPEDVPRIDLGRLARFLDGEG